jgi:uncharacterized protein YjbI with pentapeptide repeats
VGRLLPWRIAAAAIPALLIVALGTIGSPGGLGIAEKNSTKVERDKNWRITKYSIERFEGKTVWDWLGLIGVPTTLAVLGIWFQSQEQKRASREAEEHRRLASEDNKEETLQRYLDRVSQLLIEKNLIRESLTVNNPIVESASDVIRARTLSVLRSFSLDRDRKANVIFFLYETEILKSLKVSLAGADLSVANFRMANLIGINLSGANLRRANFYFANLCGADLCGADLREGFLTGADLYGANLSETKISGSCLIGANLSGANLSNSYLKEVNLFGANLSGANLCEANLCGAGLGDIQWDEKTQWPDNIRFHNAKDVPEDLKKQLGL